MSEPSKEAMEAVRHLRDQSNPTGMEQESIYAFERRLANALDAFAAKRVEDALVAQAQYGTGKGNVQFAIEALEHRIEVEQKEQDRLKRVVQEMIRHQGEAVRRAEAVEAQLEAAVAKAIRARGEEGK